MSSFYSMRRLWDIFVITSALILELWSKTWNHSDLWPLTIKVKSLYHWVQVDVCTRCDELPSRPSWDMRMRQKWGQSDLDLWLLATKIYNEMDGWMHISSYAGQLKNIMPLATAVTAAEANSEKAQICCGALSKPGPAWLPYPVNPLRLQCVIIG